MRRASAVRRAFFVSDRGKKNASACLLYTSTGIDRELLRESGKNYPAELALFVVSPSCRGQGVGKALFQAALDYTGQHKLDEIYLFTHTSCNYGFYEHQGMRRRCEREHLFHINGKAASMRFFIYD